MALQKRETKREGVTFLFYGESGSGKTPTALSFPNQLLFDSDRGTKFYKRYDHHILSESNTLVFKEMLEDLEEFENDEDLFNQVETINADSITRYYENMKHASLKVAEGRARKAGRSADSEGLAPKDWGNMSLRYDSFFAKMLTFAAQGKNVTFVAEQADKKENTKLSDGSVTSVVVGVKPNMPNESNFDFDVVVRTFKKDGNSYGEIEKDRTETFAVGAIVEKPNYTHWEEAIKLSQQGRTRSKDEIKSFEETIAAESDDIATSKEASVIEKIEKVINSLDESKQGDVAAAFKKEYKTARYKDEKDLAKLEGYLRIAQSFVK